MLVQRGRLRLDRDPTTWVRQALAAPGVVLLPLSPEAVVAAALLELDTLTDPADRLIAATAKERGAPLVTMDSRLRKAGLVRTIW
jgi:PIN domain nuclease of toxin-antitoxin system